MSIILVSKYLWFKGWNRWSGVKMKCPVQLWVCSSKWLFVLGFMLMLAIIGHTWADQLLPQLLVEQFDTFPIQCRHIEHMHEEVRFRKNIFWQNYICENLDIFSLLRLLYRHWWCLHGPINFYHSFGWNNLILCLFNKDTLNICMKEFGSEKIIFNKITAVRT